MTRRAFFSALVAAGLAAAQEPPRTEYSGPIRYPIDLRLPDGRTVVVNSKAELDQAVAAVNAKPPTLAVQAPPRRVAAPPPFRAHYECEFDPSHVCGVCATTQVVIKKWNGDGTHSHQCPRCSHTWRH